LENAGIPGAGNFSKTARREGRRYTVKIGVVEDIEGFKAQLGIETFTNVGIFEERNIPALAPASATPANLFTARRNVFVRLALFLVVLTILRSAISTSLDGFTIDEAYHIAAGVSYVRYHDFR
jgi:hypothetical protein